MPVQFTRQQQEDLERRWEEIREDMRAEYYMISIEASTSDNVIPIRDLPDNTKLRFEMRQGHPLITIGNRGGWRLDGVIGDPKGIGISELDDIQISGTGRYYYLNEVIGKWDEISKRFDNAMYFVQKRHMPVQRIRDFIFKNLALDDERLDRATFYAGTKHMSERDLFELKDGLMTDIRNHFTRGLSKGSPEWNDALEKISVAQVSLDRMFSSWNRMAGHLEWRLVGLGTERGEVTVDDVVKTARWAQKEPTMAAFRRDGLERWVGDICRIQGLSYERIPDDLKIKQIEPRKPVVSKKM